MVLITYFTRTENSRVIAEMIRQATGGDIFEIKSVQPYPEDYDACVKQAKSELESGALPALQGKVAELKKYDVVVIGYPCWWSTFPMPVKTFLTENDLSGKTILPFCTHEGSGMGNSVEDIKKFCPKARVLEGLAIRGSSVKSSQSRVLDWLKALKVIK